MARSHFSCALAGAALVCLAAPAHGERPLPCAQLERLFSVAPGGVHVGVYGGGVIPAIGRAGSWRASCHTQRVSGGALWYVDLPSKMTLLAPEKFVGVVSQLGRLRIPGLAICEGHRGDETLGQVSSLRELRTLILCPNRCESGAPDETGACALKEEPSITDAGLAYVGQMNSLVALQLDFIRVGDRGLASLRSLNRLRILRLAETNIKDEGLGHLASLRNLEVLVLSGTPVSDGGLIHLGRCVSLRAIDLSRTAVGGDGIRHLARLDHLRRLDLWESPLTDAGFAALGELHQLRSVSLSGARAKGTSLRHLARLKRLEELRLGHVSDDALRWLPESPQLRSLSLGHGITNAGAERLGILQGLTELNIEMTEITDAGMRHVGRMTSLRSLRLPPTITDDGLAHLTPLTVLRDLDVGSVSAAPSRITDTGLALISRLHRLESVSIRTDSITDAGLAELRRLKHLRRLHLASRSITDEGLSHLAALPALEKLSIIAERISDAGLRHLEKSRRLREVHMRSAQDLTSGLGRLARRGIRTSD